MNILSKLFKRDNGEIQSTFNEDSIEDLGGEVENVIYGRDLMDAIDLIKEMKSAEEADNKGTGK